MAFYTFANATTDIPLANLDANFAAIGTCDTASTLYPNASGITFGGTNTSYFFNGTGGMAIGPATATTRFWIKYNSTTSLLNIGGAGVSAPADGAINIDANNTVAIGSNPYAWTGNQGAIQSNQGSFLGDPIEMGDAHLTGNAYMVTSGGVNQWRYMESANAVQYSFSAGRHMWRRAPTGTAGALINGTGSFTTEMILDAAGGLVLGAGSVTAGYKMDINGAAYIRGGITTTTLNATTSATTPSLLVGGKTFGYTTGAGASVTQSGSRGSGVTCSGACGAITLYTAAGTTSWTTFSVACTAVAATDTVAVSVKSSTNTYVAFVSSVTTNYFSITFASTGGTATDAPVINYAIIKGTIL